MQRPRASRSLHFGREGGRTNQRRQTKQRDSAQAKHQRKWPTTVSLIAGWIQSYIRLMSCYISVFAQPSPTEPLLHYEMCASTFACASRLHIQERSREHRHTTHAQQTTPNGHRRLLCCDRRVTVGPTKGLHSRSSAPTTQRQFCSQLRADPYRVPSLAGHTCNV